VDVPEQDGVAEASQALQRVAAAARQHVFVQADGAASVRREAALPRRAVPRPVRAAEDAHRLQRQAVVGGRGACGDGGGVRPRPLARGREGTALSLAHEGAEHKQTASAAAS